MVALTLKAGEMAPSIVLAPRNPIEFNVTWDGHDMHWMPAEVCDLI